MSQVELTRQFLKTRLRRDRITFKGHEPEWKQIRDLISRTIECGESNSALIIGPRGSGKSTMISSIKHNLCSQKKFTENAIIVELNGLIETDDSQALQAVTAQMNLENAVDGKVFGSFAENLSFLLACLKSGDKSKSKSIVFILEEFDLFCAHHNQTLLYNLFDVAQSAQAPICVIGLTCRLDVIELLEKRVKSRFSHRQFFIFPEGTNNCNEWMEIFEDLLKIPNSEELKKLIKTIPKLNNVDFEKKFVDRWNKQISSLKTNKELRTSLEEMYDFESNLSSLKTFLFKLVCNIDENNTEITPKLILPLIKKYEDDKTVQLLCDLSTLELCLIIAMKHHCEIYDRDPFNFKMIMARFTKFATNCASFKNIDEQMILKAFVKIKNLELILPLNVGESHSGQFQMFHLALTYAQVKAAVASSSLTTEVEVWAKSNLV